MRHGQGRVPDASVPLLQCFPLVHRPLGRRDAQGPPQPPAPCLPPGIQSRFPLLALHPSTRECGPNLGAARQVSSISAASYMVPTRVMWYNCTIRDVQAVRRTIVEVVTWPACSESPQDARVTYPLLRWVPQAIAGCDTMGLGSGCSVMAVQGGRDESACMSETARERCETLRASAMGRDRSAGSAGLSSAHREGRAAHRTLSHSPLSTHSGQLLTWLDSCSLRPHSRNILRYTVSYIDSIFSMIVLCRV